MNSRDDWLSFLTKQKYKVFRKQSDILTMGAAKAYVFIDEHPDSLNYGDMAVAMNDDLRGDRIYIIDSGEQPNGADGLKSGDLDLGGKVQKIFDSMPTWANDWLNRLRLSSFNEIRLAESVCKASQAVSAGLMNSSVAQSITHS